MVERVRWSSERKRERIVAEKRRWLLASCVILVVDRRCRLLGRGGKSL